MDPEWLIENLGLKPLPMEGGYYRETYRGEQSPDGKSACTAIYYLLTPDTFSAIHRLPSDEIYHFYLGDPVTLLLLHPGGESVTITLGSDIPAGESPQFVVPKLTWQGSFLAEGGRFALMGTTIAPGFDLRDYEPGNRDSLIEEYPDAGELIDLLTLK